jgi:copper homeostasis protein
MSPLLFWKLHLVKLFGFQDIAQSRRGNTHSSAYSLFFERGNPLNSQAGSLFFELCAESVASARSAEAGGADRIELCSGLERGGITPSPTLMISTIAAVSLPVYVLIRPRAGDFVYSPAEMEKIASQIETAKEAGAAGVALGVLRPDRRVDVERTRTLIELARPMHVTFHRAFDETRDVGESLEDVIAAGADHLLTSGGAPDVLTGATAIAGLARQAGTRIQIIAGGGLQLKNLVEAVRRSGVYALHGSLTRESASNGHIEHTALESNVRAALRLLRQAHGEEAVMTA